MKGFHVFTVNRSSRASAAVCPLRPDGLQPFITPAPQNSNKSLFIDIDALGSHADSLKALLVREAAPAGPEIVMPIILRGLG